MTCKEVQSLIITYVNDKMDIVQLEHFLEHIEHCSDCKEELEVYYTLLTGMKQLDEDRSLSSNLHLDFENKLRKSEERVKRSKLHYMRKRAIYVGLCIIFAIITNWGIETINEEIDSKQESVTESTFLFKYYYYRNRTTPLERIVIDNYDDMMRYLIDNGMEKIK
jgi:hypothetical protein